MANENREDRRRQTSYKHYLHWLLENQDIPPYFQGELEIFLERLHLCFGNVQSLPLIKDKKAHTHFLLNCAHHNVIHKGSLDFLSANGSITASKTTIDFHLYHLIDNGNRRFEFEDALAMAALAFNNKDMIKNGILLEGTEEQKELLARAIVTINGTMPPELQLRVINISIPQNHTNSSAHATNTATDQTKASGMTLNNAGSQDTKGNATPTSTQGVFETGGKMYMTADATNKGAEPVAAQKNNVEKEETTKQATQAGQKASAANSDIVWENKDHDVPVAVRSIAKDRGPDGCLYAEVGHGEQQTFVPLDELKYRQGTSSATVPCRQDFKVSATHIPAAQSKFDEKEGLHFFLSKARAPAYLRKDI